MVKAAPLIRFHRKTGVVIPLYDPEVLETSSGGAESQTACTCKKFEGSHDLWLQKPQ
jgi:hypothetical protein